MTFYIRSVSTFLLLVTTVSFLACSKGEDFIGRNVDVIVQEDMSFLSRREYAAILGVIGNSSFVISGNTHPDNLLGKALSTEEAKLRSLFPELLPETASDYNQQNFNDKKERITVPVEKKFPTDKGYFLITDAELKELWNFERSNATEKWKAFKETYHSDGYFTTSRVGFSKDGKQALVFVVFTCGSLCADAAYYLLRFEDGSWKVQSKKTIWVS